MQKRQVLDARFLPGPIIDLIAQFTGNVVDACNWFTASYTPVCPDSLAQCIETSIILQADADATAGDPAGRALDNWLAPLDARRLRSASAGGGLAVVRRLVSRMVAAEQHPQSKPKAALLRRALATSLLAQFAVRHGAASPDSGVVPPAHPTQQAWLNGQALGAKEVACGLEWALGVGAAVATAVLLRVVSVRERAHLVPSVAPEPMVALGRTEDAYWRQHQVVQFWLQRILLDEQGASRAAAALATARTYASSDEPTFRRLLDVLAFYLELTKEGDAAGGVACLAAPAVAQFGESVAVAGLLHALATAVSLCGAGSPQATRMALAGWQLVKRYDIPPHAVIKVGAERCGGSPQLQDAFCAFTLADPACLSDMVHGVLEFIASPANMWPAHSAEVAHRMLPLAVWRAVWNATGDHAALEMGCKGALGALLVGGGLAVHHDVAGIFDNNRQVLHPSAVVSYEEVGLLLSLLEADRHKDPEVRRVASVQQVLALIATRMTELRHDFLLMRSPSPSVVRYLFRR